MEKMLGVRMARQTSQALRHAQVSLRPAQLPRQRLPALPFEKNNFDPAKVGPLGGLGTGSLTFNALGQLNFIGISGMEVHEFLPAAQCVLWQKRPQRAPEASPLGMFGPREANDTRLSAWNWEGAERTAKSALFRGLFPYMEWEYPASKGNPIRLIRKQFSPFIPHDLETSTLPMGLFEFTLSNTSNEAVETALMVSMPNLAGWGFAENYGFHKTTAGQYAQGISDAESTSVVMGSDQSLDPRLSGQWALSVAAENGLEISYAAGYDSGGPAEDVWRNFLDQGRLPNHSQRAVPTQKEQAGALAVKVRLAPGEQRKVTFALSWDLPFDIRNEKRFAKYYTRAYGTGEKNALRIAKNGLVHAKTWKSKINAWHGSILADPTIPDDLKLLLINEPYYLVEGGTLISAQGDVAALEGWLFGLHSTLDVAAWSPMQAYLFPELEKRTIGEWAALVTTEDPTAVAWKNAFPSRYGGSPAYDEAIRRRQVFDPAIDYPGPLKLPGAPHHLDDFLLGPLAPGDPKEFSRRWQNHNGWKDLNPAFVLMVWRIFYMDGRRDVQFLRQCWPAVQAALQAQRRFIRDGVPYHEGFPDQTFDLWIMQDAASYTAILTLVALEAGLKIGEQVGDVSHREEYTTWKNAAARTIQNKLWNGRYFKLDATSDDIMPAALLGVLYAKLYDLPCPIFDAQIISHLKMVYKRNFKAFGIVNGVTARGHMLPDHGGGQADDVWIGVQRMVMALMDFYGMKRQANRIRKVDLKSTWKGGLQYATPEAIDGKDRFKVKIYPRAGAAYADLQALHHRRQT